MRFPGSEGYSPQTPKEGALEEELENLEADNRMQGNIIGLHEWDREVTAREKKELEKKNEALRLQVIEDPLTGASSRVAFLTEFEQELKMIDRDILKEVSIALVDLDHFKDVNDTRGHDAGDEVLIRVVRLAKGALRRTDMLARLGGDEFAVLMPDTNRDQALLVAEKLRAALNDDSELRESGVTASLGVCTVDASTTADPKTLLKRADAAAYVSKEAGRNRVTAYEERMKMRDRSGT